MLRTPCPFMDPLGSLNLLNAKCDKFLDLGSKYISGAFACPFIPLCHTSSGSMWTHLNPGERKCHISSWQELNEYSSQDIYSPVEWVEIVVVQRICHPGFNILEVTRSPFESSVFLRSCLKPMTKWHKVFFLTSFLSLCLYLLHNLSIPLHTQHTAGRRAGALKSEREWERQGDGAGRVTHT